MKVLECVVDGHIRQRVEIDEKQCGFMLGRGTTDVIFIVRQLQKHLAANKSHSTSVSLIAAGNNRIPQDTHDTAEYPPDT